jgi:molybdate/tungstate transport system ATP-binding protein
VAAALALVGLPGFERRRSPALSVGEKQRVVLARALALETPVVLLDEPSASVDGESSRLVEAVVRRLAASGSTVVLSSHALEFAYRASDQILHLEGGRVSVGTENVLRGRVALRDEQFTHFQAGGCTILCPAREGDFSVAVLPMEDVILSLAPLASSARNQLRGTVTAVAEEAGGTLRVSVDCGAVIQALVTRAAAAELGVEPGRACMVIFKASAVRMY